MPTYSALVADKSTGRTFPKVIEAAGEREAVDRLAEEGLMVGHLTELRSGAPGHTPPPPLPPFSATPEAEALRIIADELALMRRELGGIRRSRFVRRPISTIALGIVLAGAIFFLIWLAAVLAMLLLAALGIGIAGSALR